MPRRMTAAERLTLGTRSKAHRMPRFGEHHPHIPRFVEILGDEQAARDAAREWRRLVPELAGQGLLAAIDTFALEDLCLCAARIRQCERLLAAEGIMVAAAGRSDRGQVRHPLLVALNQYRAHYQKLCKLFGIGPASRQSLDASPPLDPDSPLQTVLRMTAELRRKAAEAAEAGER